jgi:outer membrane lipoprotein-sorting protein
VKLDDERVWQFRGWAVARVLLLAAGLGAFPTCRAAVAGDCLAVQWVDRIQARLAGCKDYQYQVSCYERKGTTEERRCYRLFVKDGRLVRITVLAGRGKGSEAALDAQGQIHGHKGGLLKSFSKTLRADDPRICSLRGTPFWEAAAHNYLSRLARRMLEPEAKCETSETETSGCLRIALIRNNCREQYWIDTRQLLLTKGEIYEGNQLVEQFEIDSVRENVGLTDKFFTF